MVSKEEAIEMLASRLKTTPASGIAINDHSICFQGDWGMYSPLAGINKATVDFATLNVSEAEVKYTVYMGKNVLAHLIMMGFALLATKPDRWELVVGISLAVMLVMAINHVIALLRFDSFLEKAFVL
jgi:hypothetical protein